MVIGKHHSDDPKDVIGHTGSGAKDSSESQKRSAPEQQSGGSANQLSKLSSTDDDIFTFGHGKGTGNVINGQDSWVDTIQLTGMTQGPSAELSGEGSWVLKVKETTTYTVNHEKQNITFDDTNGSGLITLSDGSEVTFFNIEKIEW